MNPEYELLGIFLNGNLLTGGTMRIYGIFDFPIIFVKVQFEAKVLDAFIWFNAVWL